MVLISENETLKSDSLSHIFPKNNPPNDHDDDDDNNAKILAHVVHFLFLHPTGLVCREDKGLKTDLHLLLLLTSKTHACQLPSRNQKIKKGYIH